MWSASEDYVYSERCIQVLWSCSCTSTASLCWHTHLVMWKMQRHLIISHRSSVLKWAAWLTASVSWLRSSQTQRRRLKSRRRRRLPMTCGWKFIGCLKTRGSKSSNQFNRCCSSQRHRMKTKKRNCLLRQQLFPQSNLRHFPLFWSWGHQPNLLVSITDITVWPY